MIMKAVTQLRSIYEAQGGVETIFTHKVTDYVNSRPDYPSELFATLRDSAHLHDCAVVADIGAGTGLLTQGLLSAGYTVIAVEPNVNMRLAADKILGHHAAYRSVDGCAEAMPLPTNSVDLITAAQVFHWFDVDRARAECLRVLRPCGQVALIWNDRVLSDPLHIALDEIFAKFGGAKRNAFVNHDERGGVPSFFGCNGFQECSWEHVHLLDEAGLLSLIFSRSYMPARDSELGVSALAEAQKIFRRFAIDGVLAVRYITLAMIGRPV
jgi:SAM-dependent methyltransferase